MTVEAARTASAADLDLLVRLGEGLRREVAAERGGALWALREGYGIGPGRLADRIASPEALVVVGTVDDVPVGYAVVAIENLGDGSRLGVIEELFTESAARAVGVGEAMLDAVLDFCERNGCRGVDAGALPGQREAKNFFERAGFTARRLVMHRGFGSPPGPEPAPTGR